jgi:hypothetical protein
MRGQRLAGRIAVPPDPAPALWEESKRFNLFPSLYWHDSWRAQLTARIGMTEPDLDAQPFWVRTLSTAILRELRLEEEFDFDFADRAKRLALLDGATLQRLCLAIAGLLVRQHLRLLVSRDDASLIQRCLGPDIHKLVLEWRGPMPVVATVPLWSADWRSDWSDSDAWARWGVATLYSALPPETRALHGRLRLKFPVSWPHDSFAARSTPDYRPLNAHVVLTLLPLVAPGWSWLFAENATTTEVAA